MNALHLLPGCRVERIHPVDPTTFQLEAHGVRGGAHCPACGVWSEAGHGSYQRQPADLPLLGKVVQIVLRVRRFCCHNATCSRRTFAERLPGLLAAHARRTHRLTAAPCAVAGALGGEAGARLLPRLAMATSADTLLRLIRRLALPAAPTPVALGVDDWAFKRGNPYGTLLVDLESRRAVDLLPDRRAETLAAWLRPRRRQIKVVARDRSSECARGVNLGAPRAVQVADRWHLLQNTREMLTRWLFGVYGRLRRLPSTGLASSPRRGVRTRAFPRARTTQAASVASRARSLACYQKVRRRRAAGESLCAPSKKRRAWRAPPCAALPAPRASPNARCAPPDPAGSIRSSPGWKSGWPPDARTPRRSTGSCANAVIRAAAGRCTSGCIPSGSPRPTPRRPADATCHPCQGRPPPRRCLRPGSWPGCCSSPRPNSTRGKRQRSPGRTGQGSQKSRSVGAALHGSRAGERHRAPSRASYPAGSVDAVADPGANLQSAGPANLRRRAATGPRFH